MDYRRENLLQRMDKLVAWTGIKCAMGREKRIRRFKWWPMVFLGVAIAALVAEAMVPSWPLIGIYSLAGVQALSVNVTMLGPMRQKDLLREDMDEREQSWRARSNLVAYATVGLLGWIGIAVMGGVAIWTGAEGWKMPYFQSPLLTMGLWLMSLCQFLLIVFMLVPTLHASWTMPEIVEDEPEEEGRLSFLKPRRFRL